MSLLVTLSVKIRAFGITFHNMHKEWAFAVAPVPVLGTQRTLLEFNERGVRLKIEVG